MSARRSDERVRGRLTGLAVSVVMCWAVQAAAQQGGAPESPEAAGAETAELANPCRVIRDLRVAGRLERAERAARRCLEAGAGAGEAAAEGDGKAEPNPGARLELARVLAARGETAAALAVLEQLSEPLASRPEVVLMHGKLHLWRQEWSAARRWLERYLVRRPEDAAGLYYRAIAEENLGDHRRALVGYARSCKISADGTSACRAAKRLGRIEGRSLARRVAQLSRRRAGALRERFRHRREAHLELSRRLAAKGRTEAALAVIEPWVEERPEDLEARVWLATLLAREQRVEEALREFNALPEQVRKRADLRRMRGKLRVWKEDYTEAERILTAHLADRPDDAAALYWRGIARSERGDPESARADWRRSCELAPEATRACDAAMPAGSEPAGWFAFVQPGYRAVARAGDGFSTKLGGGVRLERGYRFRASGEWRSRSFGSDLVSDLQFDLQANYAPEQTGLRLGAGGGFAVDPDFSAPWDVWLEGGWITETPGLALALRYWRIQLEVTGANVFNPRAIWYLGPFFLDGRYYLSVADAGRVTHSGLGRVGWSFDAPSFVYAGLGGGDRSDFIELRRRAAERHLVLLGGVKWAVDARHHLGLDLIHRRERAGRSNYVETQVFLRWELRGELTGR